MNNNYDWFGVFSAAIFLIVGCAGCLDMVFGDSLTKSSIICKTGVYGLIHYRGFDRLSSCFAPFLTPLMAFMGAIALFYCLEKILPIFVCIVLSIFVYIFIFN